MNEDNENQEKELHVRAVQAEQARDTEYRKAIQLDKEKKHFRRG